MYYKQKWQQNIKLKYTYFMILLSMFAIWHRIGFAQDIETYIQETQCNNTYTKLCASLQNLYQALKILQKIQYHNFTLMQQKALANTKQATKEVKDFQKDDIAIVTYNEYRILKQHMHGFCKSFKNLNKEEIQILFTLQWNKKALFRNYDDIIHFCQSKY